jgi:flagellar protein FlaG
MPVDIVSKAVMPAGRGNGQVVRVHPGANGAPVTARQELPGGGQTLPQQATAQAQSEAQVRQAVRHIADYVQTMKRDLQFNVDRASGKTVIKVVDTNSGQLIRQIPQEEMISIARAISGGEGVLLRDKA